jgi:2-oxoglutarate dehydrogenase E1 component
VDDSLLIGENAAFLDEQYLAWLSDPTSVDPRWRSIFETWERPSGRTGGPTAAARSIFAASGDVGAPDPGATRRYGASIQLINAWRVRGHLQANLDPLGLLEPRPNPEMHLDWHGLTDADLDATVPSAPLFGEPPVTTLRAIWSRLKAAYNQSIGAEFMNVHDLVQRRWLQERLETAPDRQPLDAASHRRVLRHLSDAENLERLLQERFPGTKRFSLEGGEALIPLLHEALDHAASLGVSEVVIGMPHRGRLNVLANILDKPVSWICNEFVDNHDHENFHGSGDVKYHLGYSVHTRTASGHPLHISLTPNPSHLEAVNPVVEGRTRAKQDRIGDDGHKVMPILLHGDAAFAGQGLVPETLNLSELPGYHTGGTLHIVVNNQIGFTTPPTDARSTPYATDVARMLGVPIFHVNGEDLGAVVEVVRLATEWRQRFQRDVVIDLYCFRKHGHNEGDEPAFTQPVMYDRIRRRPTPRESWTKRLIDRGVITDAECQSIHDESYRALDAESRTPAVATFESPLKDQWSHWSADAGEPATAVPLDRLQPVLRRLTQTPAGFNVHPKAARVLQQRAEVAEGAKPVDWAVAELAAYGTLVTEGHPVRLSGQDVGRGTFTHRHAVLADAKTGAEHVPCKHLASDQARFDVYCSSLSEAGVLGFEFGYSWDYPEALVMWEAQFGDFCNGAQVIIDQYLAAAEQKWNRFSGLVLLLPHGYEGQGPEHSSGRIERFLQLCGEDNLQVANCTTPANLFHLLRRQALRRVRKPLIVFTPKSGLRTWASPLSDLAEGRFQPVVDDATMSASTVRRVVLCSGKVYYDLEEQRAKRQITDVALVRVEMLYPLPAAALSAALARYPAGVEVTWCQEEPKNQGAWPMMRDWLIDDLGLSPNYAGRPHTAAPATGSPGKHKAEQAALLDRALS